MPAHTTHAKKIYREIGDNFPKISRTPISFALEKNVSRNRRHFSKNLSRANPIRSRKKSIAKSDTFSQKSLACQSHAFTKKICREIGDIFPKISRATPNLLI